MAFKMKPFSGFGNSPMKNIKNFEKFQAQKQKAKDFVEKLKPQIKKKPTGNLSTTAKTKMVKQTAKGLESQAKTKMIKQVAKKGLGALVSRASGVGTILSLGYQAYKAGQKKSGGKINPKQKSIIKEGKKKIDKSKFNFPINRKFSIYNKKR
mgnify:CR=1 FL=1